MIGSPHPVPFNGSWLDCYPIALQKILEPAAGAIHLKRWIHLCPIYICMSVKLYSVAIYRKVWKLNLSSTLWARCRPRLPRWILSPCSHTVAETPLHLWLLLHVKNPPPASNNFPPNQTSLERLFALRLQHCQICPSKGQICKKLPCFTGSVEIAPVQLNPMSQS